MLFSLVHLTRQCLHVVVAQLYRALEPTLKGGTGAIKSRNYDIMRELRCLFPVARALNGTFPASIESITLISAHVRLKRPIHGPVFCDLFGALPEANGQPGQIGSTQRRRLGH